MSRNQSRRGGNKRGRADEWKADTRDATSMNNTAFETYYQNAGIVPQDSWDTFMSCLRTSLPMSVRVNISTPKSDAICADIMSRLSAVFETKRLPYFPGGKAFQCGVSRGDLKRNTDYKIMKKIVAALNEGGYLTRQEAVSMLPPLLLQAQQHHRVLDMCAAPGSKTSQILEAMLPESSQGVVVANDMNASRIDVLHHQTNRAAGAHPHLIITNYDATRFPILPSEWKFDRVLCDVMCSGDGTLRKSIDMWPRWNAVQGADLHISQCRVLLRGMTSCKKGGIVVYSTCSLNPVEDEAVVSECLKQSKGAFRLVDPGPLLPGLESSPGLTTWALTSKDLSTTMHTYEDAVAYMEAQNKKCFQYKPTMFPDTELLVQQNIHYTRRLLPHLQDTGGFFVAAFECVEEMPDRATAMDEKAAAVPIFPISDNMKKIVQTGVGLPDDFPYDQLLYRSEDAREQKVYYANKPTIALSAMLGSRVVSVGSKIFEASVKYSNEKLRISGDGVANLAPLLPDSFVFSVPPQMFIDLANGAPMLYSEFAERLGRPLDTIPTWSVLRCELGLVGTIYAVVEKSTKFGKAVARVPEWQVTLCKLALGQPVVAPAKSDEGEEEDAGAGEE